MNRQQNSHQLIKTRLGFSQVNYSSSSTAQSSSNRIMALETLISYHALSQYPSQDVKKTNNFKLSLKMINDKRKIKN